MEMEMLLMLLWCSRQKYLTEGKINQNNWLRLSHGWFSVTSELGRPHAVALSPEQLPGHKEVLTSSGGEGGIGVGH